MNKSIVNSNIELSFIMSFILSENWLSIESKAKMSKTIFLIKLIMIFKPIFLNDRETQ